ncbi:SBBP repeat-containing protein [Hymenobacter volaticus]|uniref:SBBP repeat-containing protein n=1 Tax=Hymenobacter volaticus TaxID=2932254 RepID=A0ABY4GDZ9_9BACT|nr:SBBP repeat-containing protein [Hymenobacter volaticus]UOQ69026.1 SBBP repeat-containing protein [Hymenobacter volaticus]
MAKRLAPPTAAPKRLHEPAATPSAALGTTARTSASVSEAWAARYAGTGDSYDGAADVAIDANGSVYVTGFSLGSSSGYDYVTVKYNANGFQLWEVRYNGPANSDDVPTSLAVDGAGNVYVTGSSVGTGTRYDYATVKYSPDGQQRWVARYSGPANNEDLAASLAVDAAGNVAVTGASYNGLGSSYDYLTVKYTTTGQQLWEARYNGPASSDDLPTTLALDGAGNVYVTGTSYSSSQSDYATLKYDASSGQLQWQAFYNGPGNNYDLVRELAVDATGRVAVTGLSFNGSSYDYATASYSGAGQPQWSAVHNGAGNGYDEATGVALDGTGNVLVTGYAETSGGNWDYTTFKYAAADGQPVWEARYNGPDGGYDEAKDVAVDANGDVLVTGRSFTGLGLSEYATVKYAASSGQQLWAARAQGVGSGDQQATGIAVNAAGTVAVTGTATRSTTNSNYATLTYAASGQTRWRAEGPEITNVRSEASDMAVDAAGNVFVTGMVYGGSTARWEVLTVKYAANGQLDWQARYPAEVVTGRLPHIAVDAAGNVAVAGTIYSSPLSDCLILKYEGATGRQQWARTYNGPGNGGMASPMWRWTRPVTWS